MTKGALNRQDGWGHIAALHSTSDTGAVVHQQQALIGGQRQRLQSQRQTLGPRHGHDAVSEGARHSNAGAAR